MRKRALGLAAVLAALILTIAPARAVLPDEVLKDPVLETRARTLSEELRCMVCQNQSIDLSDAPLARDLRILLRERLVAGDSDREVKDFLVARYGEFILLKPRFAWHTMLLWLTPLIALLVGGVLALAVLRRRPARPVEALSAEEERRLNDLLGDAPPR